MVTAVGGEPAFRRRIMELGVLRGTRVELVRVAPLGDPLELRVRGCALSIRRDEARAISVELAPRGLETPAAAEAAEVVVVPGIPAAP
jgi:Fe2+ transport system protein FeoA